MISEAFEIKVYLVVIAQSNKCLVIKDGETIDLPHDYLVNDINIESIVETLLFTYTGLSKYWAILNLAGIISGKTPNLVEIVFVSFIPEITNIRIPNSQWKSLMDFVEVDDQLGRIIKIALDGKVV